LRRNAFSRYFCPCQSKLKRREIPESGDASVGNIRALNSISFPSSPSPSFLLLARSTGKKKKKKRLPRRPARPPSPPFHSNSTRDGFNLMNHTTRLARSLTPSLQSTNTTASSPKFLDEARRSRLCRAPRTDSAASGARSSTRPSTGIRRSGLMLMDPSTGSGSCTTT